MIARSLHIPRTDTDQQILEDLQFRFVKFIITVSLALSSITFVIITGLALGSDDGIRPVLTAANIAVFAVNAILWRVLDRKNVPLVSTVVVLMLAALTAAVTTGFVLLAVVTLTAAAVLVSRWLLTVAIVVVVARQFIEIVDVFNSGDEFSADVTNSALIVLALVLVSAASRYLFLTARRATQGAQYTTNLLQITAEIGQETNRLLSLEELLSNAVEQIRTRFGYHHVQVYLIDDTGEQATLAASTGELGRELLERRHEIRVGSQGPVGQVAWHGEAMLVNIPQHFYGRSSGTRGELLRDMRSRLVLPISDGTAVIGALDVQSTRENTFGEGDVQALQVLTNMLGTSIRNANLFRGQERSLEENKRLFFEAQSRLQEIRRLNQQLTKAGWDDYLQAHKIITGITLQGNSIEPDNQWTEALRQAGQRHQPASRMENGRYVIAVPILLRDQVIGAVEVEPKPGAQDADTIEMMQAVASRLALSLDNARLFEEAQQSTAQEQQLNQIVEQFQTANSVDDLLRVTLTELSEVFGAQQSAIRLVKSDSEGDGNPHNGGSST